MTIDIEKAFDSLDHTFLISTLEKFGFGKTFIDSIKIFLNEQESCVIKKGSPQSTLNLKRVCNKTTRRCFSVSFYTLFRDKKTTKISKVLKCLRTLFFILLTQMIVISF